MLAPAGASAYVTKLSPSCPRACCGFYGFTTCQTRAQNLFIDHMMKVNIPTSRDNYNHVAHWCDKQSHDASQDRDASEQREGKGSTYV